LWLVGVRNRIYKELRKNHFLNVHGSYVHRPLLVPVLLDLPLPRVWRYGFHIRADIVVCRDLLVESVNPLYLRGLKQALYILHSLEKGQDNDQIIQEFDGDSQLVAIWTNFLLHNHWIKKNELGEMTVTEKGRLCIRKYGS
jgi:hypothetical protein